MRRQGQGRAASDSASPLETAHPGRALAAAPVAAQGPGPPVRWKASASTPLLDDKNRAFWVLQSIGWSGYFILRSLSGIANSMGAMFVVHTLLLTATGYSLTLLMASIFRRLIAMRALLTAILSLIVVIVASSAFSFIETWSFATFLKPDPKPVGVEYLGAILLNFSLLAAWSALYYGINYYLLLEEEIDQLEGKPGLLGPAGDARYQLNPHFLFNTLNSISTLRC